MVFWSVIWETIIRKVRLKLVSVPHRAYADDQPASPMELMYNTNIVFESPCTQTSEDQSNTAVKQYVLISTRAGQYSPYPTNEIKWVIKNATAGDYYIRFTDTISIPLQSRTGVILRIDYNSTGFNSTYSWRVNPTMEAGAVFPAGNTVRGHVEVNDFDEYKITVSGTRDVIIRLTARREVTSPSWSWEWADQTNGYYQKQSGKVQPILLQHRGLKRIPIQHHLSDTWHGWGRTTHLDISDFHRLIILTGSSGIWWNHYQHKILR